ncbi:MAG TPA: hypothetical protein VG078_05665 [Acidimicrobiales bacterium]|nr:hypothetical protein [Acidimicrobiales bacterium]
MLDAAAPGRGKCLRSRPRRWPPRRPPTPAPRPPGGGGQDLSLAELRQLCARAKAAACGDLEARRRHIAARRHLREWTDAEGGRNLRMRHNPEVGAHLMAVLGEVRYRLFRQARAEGRREHPDAHAADALVEVVCGRDDPEAPTPKGRAKGLARVDLGALLRGYPVGRETCEIAGFGPVAVSAVRDLLDPPTPSWPRS